MSAEPKKQRLACPCYALVYATMLPYLQQIAREYGYALAVHGSMATDFDLVAIPWTNEATEPEPMIEALRQKLVAHLPVRLQSGGGDVSQSYP